jgi:hypothetical protein
MRTKDQVMKTGWFEVDKRGLAALLERRGRFFAILELIQNAWDTGARFVGVRLEAIAGRRGCAHLVVEDDDPIGFTDLAHAFTLFADTVKRADPTRRGRFNLGEKLVLALCETATISSTSGTVVFGTAGREQLPQRRRAQGSQFEAIIRMNKPDLEEVERRIWTLFSPEGVRTTYNGKEIEYRAALTEFSASLPTLVADEAGVVRERIRKTTVRVYSVEKGEKAHLYELGLPVVATGDRWHYSVEQKVPLAMERDNVSPRYLTTLRTLVLNQMYEALSAQDANSSWARDALADRHTTPEAVTRMVELRFGKKAVVYDPSDLEANANAVFKGYTVIRGNQFHKDEWQRIRAVGILKPAGQVTPSPKPCLPDGSRPPILAPDHWTADMRFVAEYAKRVARYTIEREITVECVRDHTWHVNATFGPAGVLTLNVGALGANFFARRLSAELDELLVHEFGHVHGDHHKLEDYHDRLCEIAGRLAQGIRTSQITMGGWEDQGGPC